MDLLHIKDIDEALFESREVRACYLARLSEGGLTRDENARSHFCVYFLPRDRETDKYLFVHHKKANLWLPPGGHLDTGESMHEALKREIKEELGLDFIPMENDGPFFLSLTPIDNNVQPCKEHFDVWFMLETTLLALNIDPKEFNETRWVSREEALEIVTNEQVLRALKDLY